MNRRLSNARGSAGKRRFNVALCFDASPPPTAIASRFIRKIAARLFVCAATTCCAVALASLAPLALAASASMPTALHSPQAVQSAASSANPAAPSALVSVRGTKAEPLVVETTESAADAAERDATRAHRQREADNSRGTLLLTRCLLAVAMIQALFFYFQLQKMDRSITDASNVAATARDSVNLARDAFVADHRPWLCVSELVADGFPMIEEGRLLIPLSITLKNVGNSPALAAWPDVHAMDPLLSDETPVGRQAKIARAGGHQDVGIALFPGETSTIKVYALMQAAEVEACRAEGMWPWIIGVLFYKFASDESWHRTGFIFTTRVARSDPKDGLVKLGADGPMPELIQVQLSPQGSFAD